MSDELGFIQNTLTRIEEKIDDGLLNHENRISRLEGGVSGLRWLAGAIISIAAIIAAAVFSG